MTERLKEDSRKKGEAFSFFISILRKYRLQKEAKKRKTSFQIKIFMLLILVSIIFQRVRAEEHSNSYLENSAITLLPQDIVFEYNSTFSKQSFTVELSNIELDVFNSVNLFFKQEGDKTDESLKVVFLFNGTGIEFIISRLYQDQQEHNLTQAFVYPDKFNGTMNLTITCEGQTSYSHSGSLQIFCTTAIKAVEIPLLSDTAITLPIVPNSLSFRGSVASPVSRCVMTAFYNTKKLDKLNVSLSFTSNSFTAFSQYIEVELNNQVVVTEEFDDGITTTLTSILPIDTGLNFLSFHFIVSMSVDVFHFTDIQIDGFIFSFEDSLPENILSYNHWEGDEIDHTFDLSILKPVASNSHQQILHINLNYGCLGSIISPAYYELYSGTEIYSGELTESEQSQSQSIEINTFTTTYDVPLLFRIHGSVEGEGIFFILNTSTIEIKPILEFTDEATEQFESVFTKEEIIPSSISETVTRTYFDVFSTASYATRCNLSLSLTLFTETYFPVEQININLRVDNQKLFFVSIKNRKEIDITNELTILWGYHEVELTLVIYMRGTAITLQNVRYTLIPSTIFELPTYNNPVNNETSEPKKVINPSKPLFMGIEYGVDGLMIVIFIWHFFSKKNRKKEDLIEGGEIVELQMEGYDLHRGHYSKFKRSVKGWRLEKKVSILKTTLLPISLFYLAGKIIVLNFLTDQMNIIATNGIFNLKSTSLSWGYLGFAVCVYLSTLELFCIFVLVTRSTFYEDYFDAIKLLGRILTFPFIISWILLFLYISRNTHSFSTWNTGLLFLCFLIMHFFSRRLGKAIIKKHEFVFYNFKKTGRMKVKLIKNESYPSPLNPSNPLGNPSISSGNWSEKELEKYKMLLFTTIVSKIRPNVPVSPHRLAALAAIPMELIEKLLLELCNNNPALGKYYHTEQVFIRHLDSNKEALDLRNTSQRQNDENNEDNYPTSKHEIIPSSNNSFHYLNTGARNDTNEVNSPMKLEEQSSLFKSKLLIFCSKIKHKFKSYFTKDVLEHVKINGTLPFVSGIVLSLFLFLPVFFLSYKIFLYNPWINIILVGVGVFLIVELINITLRHIVGYDKKGCTIEQTMMK
ncbi:hypothetical protein ES704_02632 [subsurface metagenome]